MELDYEKDIKIDPDALDVEWLKQAELMRRYTTHAANMKKEMDESKERFDMGKAKMEMEIRKYPEIYGLTKVTEGAIQNTLLLQEEYQKLSGAFIEARYENDIATAAVRVIDQKKTALENLVRLLSASYFAGPQTPRDISDNWNREIEERGRKEENTAVKIRKGKSKSKNKNK